MPRALVTGGAGFIGSHVAERLLADGYEVGVIDDLSTGRRENVPDAATFQHVDITERELLDDVVRAFSPDVICHLGAQASVTVSVAQPERDLEVNVRGTLNVCRSAASAGCPTVFASTGGALYGDGAPLPTDEAFPPAPVAPYGASKHAGEAYVGAWGRLHDLPNAVLRLGNVYGPRQNPYGEAGVVAIFSDRLLRAEPPIVFGYGRATRDYVHVADVAAAFLSVVGARIGGTFNVGTGRATPVSELLEYLQRAAGTALDPELRPLRAGELQSSALDPRRLLEACGWAARIPLEEGLAETYRWYRTESRPAPAR